MGRKPDQPIPHNIFLCSTSFECMSCTKAEWILCFFMTVQDIFPLITLLEPWVFSVHILMVIDNKLCYEVCAMYKFSHETYGGLVCSYKCKIDSDEHRNVFQARTEQKAWSH